MKDSITFSYFLMGVLVFLSACGSSPSPTLERTFGVAGESYCDEVNQVFYGVLEQHLFRTRDDAPELYSKALGSVWNSIYYSIEGKVSDATIFDLKNSKTRSLPEGRADLSRLKNCQDLREVQDFLDRNYIEPINMYREVNREDQSESRPEIFYKFLSSFARHLDWDAGFYLPETSKTYDFGFVTDLDRQKAYNLKTDYVEVIATRFEDSPIKVGDRIYSVESQRASGLKSVYTILSQDSWYDLQNLFLNSPTSQLTVLVERKDTQKRETVTLRGDYSKPLPKVIARMEGPYIYVKILEFDRGMAIEFLSKVSELRSQISDRSHLGIILDLRYNPGGYVLELLSLVDMFLDYGEIGQWKSKEGLQSISLETPGLIFKEPLVLLTNHGSASASDMATQILKETNRAMVVGETTHGKGTGYSTYVFGINAHLKGVLQFTDFQFYGPSGLSPELDGISPHILITDSKVEEMKSTMLQGCGLKETKNGFCYLRRSDTAKDYPDLLAPADRIYRSTPMKSSITTEVDSVDIPTEVPNKTGDLILDKGIQVLDAYFSR